MSTGIEPRDAASDAAYRVAVELWTLYSIGVTATLLRTYARVITVGWRNLRLDDLLIWIAIIFYTTQTALAYSVGNVAHGLANNSMTSAQRASLSPSDPEYGARVIGSKIQVAGWTTYVALINSLKLSMLAFYVRLMNGLGRRYQLPIWIGFGLVVACFLASIIAIFASCRPFYKNWQINPDPGSKPSLSHFITIHRANTHLDICQPAISKPVIGVTFASNLLTDPYIILIPIPMLWKSSLKLIKKIATTIVLSAGVFILVCATLKSVLLLVEPDDGAEIANEWGTRETFVAVVTTNLPMVFHLFRTWLAKIFGGVFQSSQKAYRPSSGALQTIGGGSSRQQGLNSNTTDRTIRLAFTESEERMMGEIKMQNLKPIPNAILVENQVDVRSESRDGKVGGEHVGERSVVSRNVL
ncbi:uncharacterized protein N7498_004248 [Penicillium cinerascens]|uniref:Rhodopsin domain-containing protein n=1 Tax=Penicillium cinerascens TaxID=70096 RepID=A0A9W9N3Q9_9EURO|nr:uncharacterized protein N7498_004248 [Penicillium cinerascens]KAJ5212602.1 hypothetical protein N7498_004248 [Penicillium cinerascens]